MGILCMCNEKMQRSYIIEAICNKIFTVNNVGPYFVYTSIYSNFFEGLKNNVFLLLDNIREIIVFK